MKWIEEYRINAHDTDINRLVSPGGVFRVIQDTANLQMEGQGPSYLELFDRGYSFVLSRIRVALYNPMFSHDRLVSETWALPSHGYVYGRGYRLLREGEVMAEGDSVWALVDLKTGHPVRVGEVVLNYTEDEPPVLDLPARVHVPRELELRLVKEHTVSYLETDVNGHMNNTYYPDMFCDCLPMRGIRVTSVEINYLSPVLWGDSVKIYRGTLDGTEYFRAVGADGAVHAEAALTTEPCEE